MIWNRDRYSSVISSSTGISSPTSQTANILDDNVEHITVSSDSSGVQWWVPENQLGLDPPPEIRLQSEDDFQHNDQVVALDEIGEVKHHVAIAKY